MWAYEQSSGRLFDGAGNLVGSGYSGSGLYENMPQAECLHNQGPIPKGLYHIGQPVNTVTHGPFVLPLTPDPGNEMFGRFGFLIHGDSVIEPGTASQGCIILPHEIREAIAISGDTDLQVKA